MMMSVEEIQSAIVALPPDEYARLRRWFIEKSWEHWDREIEEDAASGKLDFLVEEAIRERDRGQLREL